MTILVIASHGLNGRRKIGSAQAFEDDGGLGRDRHSLLGKSSERRLRPNQVGTDLMNSTNSQTPGECRQ